MEANQQALRDYSWIKIVDVLGGLLRFISGVFSLIFMCYDFHCVGSLSGFYCFLYGVIIASFFGGLTVISNYFCTALVAWIGERFGEWEKLLCGVVSLCFSVVVSVIATIVGRNISSSDDNLLLILFMGLSCTLMNFATCTYDELSIAGSILSFGLGILPVKWNTLSIFEMFCISIISASSHIVFPMCDFVRGRASAKVELPDQRGRLVGMVRFLDVIYIWICYRKVATNDSGLAQPLVERETDSARRARLVSRVKLEMGRSTTISKGIY